MRATRFFKGGSVSDTTEETARKLDYNDFSLGQKLSEQKSRPNAEVIKTKENPRRALGGVGGTAVKLCPSCCFLSE